MSSLPEALTLPGDISGLLRRGSPVFWGKLWGLVVDIHLDEDIHPKLGNATIAYNDRGLVCTAEPGSYKWGCVALNLSDPTGQMHAVWWAMYTLDTIPADTHLLDRYLAGELFKAVFKGGVTDQPTILALRDLCLRLAGRAL